VTLFEQTHLESFYRLCLEREVKLAYGSDAHDLDELALRPEIKELVKRLGVTPEHFWYPPSQEAVMFL
jgi:histidinol phosphatase-like PHP family hydrolase